VLVDVGTSVLLGITGTVCVTSAIGEGVALGCAPLVAVTLVGQYVGGGSVGFGSYTCSLAHHANTSIRIIITVIKITFSL
jgi:hypothetical protein